MNSLSATPSPAIAFKTADQPLAVVVDLDQRTTAVGARPVYAFHVELIVAWIGRHSSTVLGIKREYLATYRDMKIDAYDVVGSSILLVLLVNLVEATPGIEPGCTDLQSAA